MFKAIKSTVNKALARLRPEPRQQEEIEMTEFPPTAAPLVYLDLHIEVPPLNIPPIDLSGLKSLFVIQYATDFTKIDNILKQQPRLDLEAIQRIYDQGKQDYQDIKNSLGYGI